MKYFIHKMARVVICIIYLCLSVMLFVVFNTRHVLVQEPGNLNVKPRTVRSVTII